MIVKPPPLISASTQIASGAVSLDNLSSGARPEQNLLVNPGFNFAQRQNPTALTTIADNTYSADQWKVTRSSAGVQYQRVSNSGVAGWISANSGQFKKITATGRMVIFQPIENLVTLGLLNQTVNFQISVNFSTARAFRIALINYSGAADVVSAMISNFTTSPMTLNANFAYLANPLVSAASAGTGVGVWNVSVTMPGTGISNLICAIMVEDVMSIGDTVNLGEGHLNIGADVRAPWYPLPAAEDIARCERFFEKSYDIDTVSGTVTALGAVDVTAISADPVNPIRYSQRKAVTPVVTPFSTTGASGKWRTITGAADVAAAGQNIGLAACGIVISGPGLVDGDELAGHFTLEAGL